MARQRKDKERKGRAGQGGSGHSNVRVITERDKGGLP